MPSRSKEDQQEYEAARFKVRAQRGFVQFGPRYWPPLDDTVSFAAERTGVEVNPVHPYAVLLERNDFSNLLGWLCRTKSGRYEIDSGQTKAVFVMGSDGLKIEIGYPYLSGFTSSQVVFLSPSAISGMIEWMDDKETNGWAGWRSGVKREELKDCSPSKADWCVNIIVDRGTGYLADGDDYTYFTGPADMDYAEWKEWADKYAFPHQLVEFTATPVSQGRHWRTARKSTFKTQKRGY